MLQSTGWQRVGHDRVTEKFSIELKVKVNSLSRAQLFVTPWTVAPQAPLSMGFSRQEYWSGLPFPSPGDLPEPGIKPSSPSFEAGALTSEPPGKPNGCESWTIKKAKHGRTDAFELWYWRIHLRVPWTAKRSKQSVLKEINPEHSLEVLMPKQASILWPPDVKSRLFRKP